MNELIREIYRTETVRDRAGMEHKLKANISKIEGEFLDELITSAPDISQTVEVGCAYGIASLFICSALSSREAPKHIIIDPFQHTSWHGIGILNLQRAGFNFFELVEQPSEFALPELARSRAGAFDMVFIDGIHTFDHTLLDLFYANLLIRVGGYIVIDDCVFSPVAKAVSYVANIPAYEVAGECKSNRSLKRTVARVARTVIPLSVAGYILPRNLYDYHYIRAAYTSMVALRKVAEDNRNWDWFQAF